jgi:hypothetical protein
MSLTTELDTLKIREPSAEERTAIATQFGIARFELPETAFVIETKSTTGFVVACEFATAEDGGDYKTPSSLLIGS